MEHQQQSGHHHLTHKDDALIQQLFACATACENCAASCLEEQDATAMAHCIEVNRDCADICFLGAKLLIRYSQFAHEFLAICEMVCRHCAEECEKHEHEHCKRCAEACRRCEEACHEHHGLQQK